MEEDPYGIEYYTVPAIEQIFVNGVVTPEQSQEFYQKLRYKRGSPSRKWASGGGRDLTVQLYK